MRFRKGTIRTGTRNNMSGRKDTSNQEPRCRYCGSVMRHVITKSPTGVLIGKCPRCEGAVTSLPPGDHAARKGQFIASIMRLRPGFE